MLLILVGCGKPPGTIGRYLAAQPVVSSREMEPLIAFLRNGEVAAFNRLRTNPPYAGKRLDFRGSSLAGRSIPGLDLGAADNSGAIGLDRLSPDAGSRGSLRISISRWMRSVIPVFLYIFEVTALILGSYYLYFRHRQRAQKNWTPREDPAEWVGHGIDVSQLRPQLQQLRRAHVAARLAPGGVCFHRYLLGFARRVILQSGYFRQRQPEEHLDNPGP